MDFPDELSEHLWRWPTRAARIALAARFDLPYDDGMQDWEYEIDHPDDLNDYFAAYESGELSDDERFTLMEMIIDCVESNMDFESDSPHFRKATRLIEENAQLHLATIWYWASTDCVGQEPEFSWQVAPAMRAILWRHRDLWE